jgi:dienelactone hydrolase
MTGKAKYIGTGLWPALLLGLAFTAPALGAASPEKISIASVTPTGLPQFLHHQAPAATVSGDLYLPAGPGPFPALILKHGSGGLQSATGDNLRKWAATVVGWGVAAFVVDSFGPRGVTESTRDQGQLSTWADIADSFAALKVLAADPRIDKTRIGIMGWSRGGEAAAYTALETARKAAIDDDLKFAVHIIFYASTASQYRDNATDRAPMLFLHGEADNYDLAATTRDYSEWLKSMGNPVTFIAYPKTHHDFDVPGQFSGFAKDLQVFSHCDLVVDIPSGHVVRMGHEEVTQTSLEEMHAYFKSCITHGATIEYNAKARADAVEKVHDFLKANFRSN